MRSDILVLGKGFVGSRIREGLGCQASGDKILTFEDAQKQISQYKPKVIINAIGHIGRNVDECELDKDKSLSANVFVPLILAEACLRSQIKLVHISSGCIYHYNYETDAPLTEERPPDFFELFYSRTKIYTEAALNALSRKYPVLIARIRVPLDNRPHPRNILTKLLGFKQIIDLPNSVTYLPDFVEALNHLIEIDARGIYNVVNRGGLKYPELLDTYKKYAPGFEYQLAGYKQVGLVRTNLILSVEKLEQSGFKVRDIHEVLEECVKEYLKY